MYYTRYLVVFLAAFLVVEICAGPMKPKDWGFLDQVRQIWTSQNLRPTSWGGDANEACSWQGITCQNDNLTSLNLTGLTGPSSWALPTNLVETNLQALILPSVGLSGTVPALPATLTHLDLSRNGELGGSLPLFSTSTMVTVKLNHNSFTGQIPWTVTSACTLVEVTLSSNLLNGYIPDWQACHTLETLSIASNPGITGPIPNLEQIASLHTFDASFNDQVFWTSNLKLPANLQALYLVGVPNSEGKLISTIPATLKTLHLRGTNVSGTIPASLFSSSSALTFLDLSGNSLEGSIPPSMNLLQNIVTLELDGNQLVGTIPKLKETLMFLSMIGNQMTAIEQDVSWSRLIILRLSGNKLSGTVPAGALASPSLSSLDLAFNNLEGTVPVVSMGLRYLDLSFNNFTSVPRLVLTSPQLETLILANNLFSGSLPSSLGSGLQHLNARNNRFSGSIPAWSTPGLKEVYLGNNALSGSLPAIFSTMTSLEALGLQQNELTGNLPALPPSLITLHLENNAFFGSFPTTLTRLEDLYLTNNSLTGDVAQLTTLPNIQQLFIGNNRFSGSLPPSMSGSLLRLVAGYNDITGTLPTFPVDIQELNLQNNHITGSITDAIVASLTNVVALDLSGNGLQGHIPDLRPLKVVQLNLANNGFVGSIPRLNDGPTSTLSHLNLGNNQLSGSINAPDFYKYYYLSYLNLENNQLSGPFVGYLMEIALHTLKLGNNQLGGSLPPNSQVTHDTLRYLDVHSNRIGTGIPSWVGSIGIEYIDLSNNRFTLGVPSFLSTPSYLNISSNRLSLCDPAPQGIPHFSPGQCDLVNQTVCAQSEACKARYTAVGCPTTILTTSVCPRPCNGPKPREGFFCEHGVWVSTGVEATGTITITSTTTVEGNFSMSGEVIFKGSTTVLEVHGCTDLSGTMIVELTEEQVEEYLKHPEKTKTLLTSEKGWCSGGKTTMGLEVRTPKKSCRKVESSSNRVGNSILVSFQVSTNGCTSASWWKAILGVAGAVVIAVVIIALFFTYNQAARRLVRPYAKFNEKTAQDPFAATESSASSNLLAEPLLDLQTTENDVSWSRDTQHRHLSEMEQWRRG